MSRQSCCHSHWVKLLGQVTQSERWQSDARYLAFVASLPISSRLSHIGCAALQKMIWQTFFYSFCFCFVITSAFVQISCNRSMQTSHQDESLHSCGVKFWDRTPDSCRRRGQCGGGVFESLSGSSGTPPQPPNTPAWFDWERLAGLAGWSLWGGISVRHRLCKVDDALSGLGSRVFPVYHTNKLEN